MSKRIGTTAGVIQREYCDQRGRVGQVDARLLVELAHGGGAVGGIALALARVDGAAREHPGARP